MGDLSIYIPREYDNEIEFKLFNSGLSQAQPHKDTGILALAQRAIITVRRTAGEDSFRDDYGGSILDLIGKTVIYDENVMRSLAVLIIQKSEQQMIQEQTEEPIPDDLLMLDKLVFLDFRFDSVDPTNMVLEFEVHSQAGQQLSVRL